MSDAFLVKPLVSAQIGMAFPLISVVDGEVTEAQWSDYATSLLTAPVGIISYGIMTVQSTQNFIYALSIYGIMTVQSTQNFIYALSIYWIKPDLKHRKLLEIENFAVVDVIGNLAPARVLLEGLDKLARRQDCDCISISLLNPYMRRWLRDSNNPARDLFRSVGFRGEQLRLRKCFFTT
jgi:hypothetical protein